MKMCFLNAETHTSSSLFTPPDPFFDTTVLATPVTNITDDDIYHSPIITLSLDISTSPI